MHKGQDMSRLKEQRTIDQVEHSSVCRLEAQVTKAGTTLQNVYTFGRCGKMPGYNAIKQRWQSKCKRHKRRNLPPKCTPSVPSPFLLVVERINFEPGCFQLSPLMSVFPWRGRQFGVKSEPRARTSCSSPMKDSEKFPSCNRYTRPHKQTKKRLKKGGCDAAEVWQKGHWGVSRPKG